MIAIFLLRSKYSTTIYFINTGTIVKTDDKEKINLCAKLISVAFHFGRLSTASGLSSTIESSPG